MYMRRKMGGMCAWEGGAKGMIQMKRVVQRRDSNKMCGAVEV